MALFNFPYFNHGAPYLPIQDNLMYIKLALEEAGHDVYINPDVEEGAVNVLFENFNDEQTDMLLLQAKAGTKIVIFASETPTGGTFNDFKTKDSGAGWYGRNPVWDMRYRNFLRVAEACKQVWCYRQDQLDLYAKIVPSSWLHFVPLGYVAGLATVRQMPYRLKDIDFIFTGTMTGQRLSILNKLQDMGYRVFIPKNILPDFIRDNICARAKICLGLKQYEEWEATSLIRDYYHLMNGTYYIAEACKISSPVNNYVATVTSGHLIDACVEAQKRTDLNEIAAQNLERYRQEIPAKPLIAAFLAKVLG